MTGIAELRDKLDASANGPKGGVIAWAEIDWPQVDDDVRRLRQRIFTATRVGDLKRVRNLQKLMLRSRANACHRVRRVTQINAGRHTAGVDGQIVVNDPGRAELACQIQHCGRSYIPQPVRRVYIPKANGKRRPLGAGSGNRGSRALNAFLATFSTASSTPVILAIKLRKGSANSARGARLVADPLSVIGPTSY